MKDRKTQMMYLLFLTSVSLVPIYVLLGWQSGGHSSNDVAMLFWYVEAGAWGLRALVESAALVYLFNTRTTDKVRGNVLIAFEVLLIGLIVLTVGLVIVANGNKQSIATGLWSPLYWVWSFGVAAFAPLMMGSVGFAYKIHEADTEVAPVNDETITHLQGQIAEIQKQLEANKDPLAIRRQRVLEAMNSQHPPTQAALAQALGVSTQTIRADIKALNGRVTQ